MKPDTNSKTWLESVKVLLVDDEDIILESYGDLLRSWGCNVMTASSGAEALRKYTHFAPDVVITDMRMGEMNGVTLLNSLPEIEGMTPGKIIITAFDDEEAFEYAKKVHGGAMRIKKGAADEIETLQFALARAVEIHKVQHKVWERTMRLFNIVDTIHNGIMILPEDKTIAFANLAAKKMLGFASKQMAGMSVAFPEKGNVEIEFKKAGEPPVTADVHVTQIDWDGQMAKLATLYDITERKKAEKALTESETRFRHLVEELPAVFWLTDINAIEKILYVSPAFEKIWGKPCEKVYNNPHEWVQSMHPADRTAAARAFMEWVSGKAEKYDVEFRIIRPDGEIRWIHDIGAKWYDETGVPVKVSGLAEDITRRKADEHAVREADMMFRSLVEQSLLGVYIIQDGIFEYANPYFLDIFGYEQDELIGKISVMQLVHPDDRPLVTSKIASRLAGQKLSEPYSFRAVAKNGRILDILAHGSLSEYRGRPAIVGTLMDITERKLAEVALKESERKFRRLFEIVPAAVIMQNRKGEIILSNKAASEILGMGVESLLGRKFFDEYWSPVHEDNTPADEYELPFAISMKTGKPARGKIMGIYSTDPQKMKWLLVNSEPIFLDEDKSVDGVIVSFIDITDRKKSEIKLREQSEQLALSEKMAAVGILASGVAHELNQPLNHISIVLHNLAKQVKALPCFNHDKGGATPSEKLIKKIEEMKGSVARAGEIIQTLRDFAVQDNSDVVKFDVKKSVINALKMLGAQLRNHNINCEVKMPDDPVYAMGGENGLGQVLLNLLVNARDALDACNDEREKEISIKVNDGKSYVTLSVTDNANGIPANLTSKIFEVFFTTKADGKGTGQGLAICRRIVSRYGGKIEVESRENKGSTFLVKLKKPSGEQNNDL